MTSVGRSLLLNRSSRSARAGSFTPMATRPSFTPHFFVSGTEVRDWRGDLDDQLKRITAEPARASIRIHAEATGPEAACRRSVRPPRLAPADPLALFVALTEDKLTSKRFGRRESRRHLVTRSRRAEMDRTHCIECRSGRFQAGGYDRLGLESRAAGRCRFCPESANGRGAASGRSITMPAVMKMNGTTSRSRSRRRYRFGRS